MQFPTLAIIALVAMLAQAAPPQGYSSEPFSPAQCSKMMGDFDEHMRASEAEVPTKLTRCRQLANCAMKMCGIDVDNEGAEPYKDMTNVMKECFQKQWVKCLEMNK